MGQEDIDAERNALLDELAAIEARIDAKTFTAEDSHRFMKLILKLTGFSVRP